MTQQEELHQKIDELPSRFFGEVIDFIGYLQYKARLEECDTEFNQETREWVNPLSKDDNGKIRLTKEMVEEMERNSPTLHKLAGILKTDMTIDEIRMARLAKHL